MSSRDYFCLSDLYHVLDETTALEPIDDVLGTGLPLISFQNLGSMLFAEDRGVPVQFHTAPEFLLRAGRRAAYVVTDEAQEPCSSRPPARIDDHLVAHMKRPIPLPSSGYGSVDLDNALSYSDGYVPALGHPMQPATHRRHRSTSFMGSRSSGLIPPHHNDPRTSLGHPCGPPPQEDYRESLRSHSPSSHVKRPSLHHRLPPPLPSLPPSRFH